MAEIEGPGGPPPSIPDDLTIVQFMFDYQHPIRPIRRNDSPWFIEDTVGRKVRIDEIRSRTHGLANALSTRWQIGEDDVVCIFGPNDVDYPVVVWAAHRLGAVVTTANPSYTAGELEYQLTMTKAKIIVVHPLIALVAVSATASLSMESNQTRIVLFNSHSGFSDTLYPTINELIAYGLQIPLGFIERHLKPGESKTKLAFLLFTSGTTGKPKAICVPHYGPISNLIQMAHMASSQFGGWKDQVYRPGDVAIALLPFYHIYGLVVVMHFLPFYGMPLVVVPKFNLAGTLRNVERYHVNFMPVVPPIVVLLCKHPEVKKHDLSSLRAIMCSAAPLSAELIVLLRKLLPNISIGQAYGTTETGLVTFPNVNRMSGPSSSTGRLFPGILARIITPDGSLAGYGESGELVVKGPANALRYLNNEEATKETFVDGWVHTGDAVSIAETGELTVVDRIKELLKVKGFLVAPAELEGLLLSHSDVSDVCVVGVPDDYSGEVPLAFVVPRASALQRMRQDSREANIIKNSLVKYVEDSVMYYKRLTGGVEFIDVIPRNPSGKILRRVLRNHARELRVTGKPSKIGRTRL